jgi:hypothetical protein
MRPGRIALNGDFATVTKHNNETHLTPILPETFGITHRV